MTPRSLPVAVIPTGTADVSPPSTFRVAIRDDNGATLGHLPGTTLTETREVLDRMHAAYPCSVLQALFHDDDLGGWRDVTADDMDRMADAAAARVLAAILATGALPRISWTLHPFDPGTLRGSADTPGQVREYARAWELALTDCEDDGGTRVCATGAFRGVEVRICGYSRKGVTS
ncbi:hypothetical protein [Spongiactinospora sp. TRM90649]|uniref:hypothetical protein n=1 Tax=Spongiactinospora sp. TRM90649 TaxID=3031114 RepID=UPI0023F7871A|nr:hypothetical protein [Spongiactinospora sp. TRM90649]MDF5758642.1 hypothetical protein [Spongiactinospora sp. TRM90649]